jgi:hypothetical protein
MSMAGIVAIRTSIDKPGLLPLHSSRNLDQQTKERDAMQTTGVTRPTNRDRGCPTGCFSLWPDLMEWVAASAAARGVSKSAIVRDALVAAKRKEEETR